MKEKMELWMERLTEETTVTKRELALLAAVCTLVGMVVGMLLAKMATGWTWSLNIMSNNGNDSGNDNGNYDTCGGEDVCAPKNKKKCKR
ncbi:MAG: hypothetical protein NC254_11315 [bacterium]|nr:hypothetical protein [bacterium]